MNNSFYFSLEKDHFFFVDLLGFSEGLLPGVSLLSLLLLSRVPSFFLGFGPGLIASIFI